MPDRSAPPSTGVAGAADAGARDAETRAAGAADTAADDTRTVEPPAGTATTFEDLPGDLFGEEDDPPPSAVPNSHSEHAPKSHEPPAAAESRATDAGADEDDVLAAVQRLFPGRILALEPAHDPLPGDLPSDEVPPAAEGPPTRGGPPGPSADGSDDANG